MNENFEYAFHRVLIAEGGLSNDKDDHGFITNKGITQIAYDHYRFRHGLSQQSVTAITNDEIRSIYYDDYWLAGRCDALPKYIDIFHFDTCVNNGDFQAAKLLQRALGVQEDGNIGPLTLRWVNDMPPRTLLYNYARARMSFDIKLAEKDPTQIKFVAGWILRIFDLYNDVSMM